MSYAPRNSGCLTGGGPRKFKARRAAIRYHALRHQIPDIHLSDQKAVKTQVWDFDPQWEFEYSNRELLLMSEKILLEDPKHWSEEPYWLPVDRLIERTKREIYCGNGTPDPAVASGMYWRSHPDGRKTATPEQRSKTRCSFYK